MLIVRMTSWQPIKYIATTAASLRDNMVSHHLRKRKKKEKIHSDFLFIIKRRTTIIIISINDKQGGNKRGYNSLHIKKKTLGIHHMFNFLSLFSSDPLFPFKVLLK